MNNELIRNIQAIHPLWSRTPEAQLFFQQMKERQERSERRLVERTKGNLVELFQNAMENLNADDDGKNFMGGRFNSMHGGPIDFTSDLFKQKPVAFQVPPNQVVVIYAPKGTVVRGSEEQDWSSWLFFKQKYFPVAGFSGNQETCYGANMSGQIEGKVETEKKYYDEPSDLESAKKKLKESKKDDKKGNLTQTARRKLEREVQKRTLEDQIEKQATKMAEYQGILDETDWNEFKTNLMRNPTNESDGSEIMWDMQIYFGGDLDKYGTAEYDGDWIYNQHHQFEIGFKGSGSAKWDNMFQNYKLGLPVNDIREGLVEAPIGCKLEHLDGNPHKIIYDNPYDPQQNNFKNDGTPQDEMKLNHTITFNGNTYTLGPYTVEDYQAAQIDGKETDSVTGWTWQQYGETPSAAFNNNAWLVKPGQNKLPWLPDVVLKIYGDENFDRVINSMSGNTGDEIVFEGVSLIKNRYELHDERRSMYARTPFRDFNGSIYSVANIPEWRSDKNYVCPYFNNGKGINNVGDINSGSLESLKTSNNSDYTSLLGLNGREDPTSKLYSCTSDILGLHYKARKGNPGLTVLSSCQPNARTKRLRGQRTVATHVDFSWSNVIIRSLCAGKGRDNFCRLRSDMHITLTASSASSPAVYVPQWRDHKGITIMMKDDKHEYYTIFGNYLKAVGEGRLLFFPQAFSAFISGGNSDPTNKIRTQLPRIYNNWYGTGGQQNEQQDPYSRSRSSIVEFGLLPYLFEIQLWDINRGIPVPNYMSKRRMFWKKYISESPSGRVIPIWKVLQQEQESGASSQGGRRKKTKRKRRKNGKKTRRRKKH